MSGPVIQGWCPGALRPMASGDGLVIRVRPPGGRLTAARAAGIAALAQAHGNGLIDLSARANMQLRGVTQDSHAPLLKGLAALDLLDPDATAEARRNIVTTLFWSAGDLAPRISAALAAALAGPDAPQTPGKFGYAIDTGTVPVLRGVAADIRIERDDTGGLICRADGADHGVSVDAHTAATVALDLARWFVAAGGVSQGRGRMAALLRNVALPGAFARVPVMPVSHASQPRPGLCADGLLVGCTFGQMNAATLHALSDCGDLRITPWRMILIEGANAAPDIPALITRADDPLLRVVACTGAPGCLQAARPTRTLARALAPHVPPGAMLHISGCTKGCAHPRRAALTLTARANGFDLIRDGTAADAPTLRGLSTETLIHTPTLLTGPPDAPL